MRSRKTSKSQEMATIAEDINVVAIEDESNNGSAEVSSNSSESLYERILVHFDNFQKSTDLEDKGDLTLEEKSCGYLAVKRRAGMIQKDIIHFKKMIELDDATRRSNTDSATNSNGQENVNEMMDHLTIADKNNSSTLSLEEIRVEIFEAVLHCINSALKQTLKTTSSGTSKEETETYKSSELSILNILNLSAFLTCTVVDLSHVDTILNHVSNFLKSSVADQLRLVSARFFGYCITYFTDILMLSMQAQKKQSATQLKAKGDRLRMTYRFLHPRLLDKSQAVRLAATTAFENVSKMRNPKRNDDGVNNALPTMSIDALLPPLEVLETLMQNAQHDSSIVIRAASLRSLPLLAVSQIVGNESAEEDESSNDDDSESSSVSSTTNFKSLSQELINIVLSRIRDEKVKVRVEALNVLISRNTGTDFQNLTTENRLFILQNGLSKRCESTRNKTIELICSKWLRSFKFNLIDMLRQLDPFNTDNEDILEEVIKIIFSVAWEEDSQEETDEGVCQKTSTSTSTPISSTVLKELSSPEIRALKENIENVASSIILKKKQDNDLDFLDDDEQEGKANEKENGDSPSDGMKLDAAIALFLRVKCYKLKYSSKLSEVQKAQHIQKIVPDVPMLCEVLRLHLDELSQYKHNKRIHMLDEVNDEAEMEQDEHEEEQCFICLQLIKITKYLDDLTYEEGSRRYFLSILHEVLVDYPESPEELVQPCIHALAYTLGKNAEIDFLTKMSLVLQDILSSSSSFSGNSADFLNIDDCLKVLSPKGKFRIVNILSVVLESISSNVRRTNTGDLLMNQCTKIIMSLVEGDSEIHQEGGVSCLGKLLLLNDGGPILFQQQSLLTKIAINEKISNAIRAQAALSLCDLALISPYTSSKETSEDEEEEIEMGDVERDMSQIIDSLWNHSKGHGTMKIITSEICIKLMFSNKYHNVGILSELLLMFFNPNYFENSSSSDMNEDEWFSETEVGSATRLKQLLSVFFPAYALRGNKARRDLVHALKPLLIAIGEILSKQKKKNKKISSTTSSSTLSGKKIVEYVCSIVDIETGEEEKGKKTSTAANVTTSDQRDNESDNDNKGKPDQLNKNQSDKDTNNGTDLILSAMNMVSQVLVEHSESFSSQYTKSLFKTLHSTVFVIRDMISEANVNEKSSLLPEKKTVRSLYESLEAFEDLTENEGCLKEIDDVLKATDEILFTVKKNRESLDNVEDLGEDEEELVDAMKEVSICCDDSEGDDNLLINDEERDDEDSTNDENFDSKQHREKVCSTTKRVIESTLSPIQQNSTRSVLSPLNK